MTGIPCFRRVVGRDHRVYTHAEIDPILEYFTQPELPYGALTKISSDTGIPVQTLFDWRMKRSDPATQNWFPLAAGHPGKRVFHERIEKNLFEHIQANLIESGLGASRDDVKILALNMYASLPVEDLRVDQFAASKTYVTDFMARYRLTLHSPHEEKRTAPIIEAIERYKSRYISMQNDYPPNRILNFDETCWRTKIRDRFLAGRGIETIRVRNAGCDKDSLTAFGCITMEGEKLPLWAIIKGKTDRCHVTLNTTQGTILRHSESGWNNESLMIEYLYWLHDQMNREPCLLIMDLHMSHTSKAVFAAAAELDIEILLIPAGCTGDLQPLDRRIFGELKSRASRLFRRAEIIEGGNRLTRQRKIDILEQSWWLIPPKNIRKAWLID
jgi:hypothetical protein